MKEWGGISEILTEPGGFTRGIEGPACDREGSIYAVNYAQSGTIGKVTPEGKAELWLRLPDGCIGNGIRYGGDGSLLVADWFGHHIFRIDVKTRELTVHAHEPRMHQPNDIAIARDGTLFASDPHWDAGTGRVWRIDPDGTAVLLDEDCGTANGIELSPDERTLYVNESVQRRIWAYDLDGNNRIRAKRLLAAFEDYSLDGMRCDMEGRLYATRYGKGTVAVIAPSGELLREIRLHGKDCTNLTFGGEDGTWCYVTVADNGNLERFRADVPGRCWGMWRR